MNIKPLGDRVLVRPASSENKTKSGIFIPEVAVKRPLEGTVISVGKNVSEVKPEDVVMYGPYSGTMVKIKEEDLLIMRVGDIFAVNE